MKIEIYCKNEQVGVRFSEKLTLPEALQLYFSGALAILKSYTPRPVEPLPPKQFTEKDFAEHQQAKGEIYDMFNAGASQVLKLYAPEFELHPTLTEQAIYEAENAILKRDYGVTDEDIARSENPRSKPKKEYH